MGEILKYANEIGGFGIALVCLWLMYKSHSDHREERKEWRDDAQKREDRSILEAQKREDARAKDQEASRIVLQELKEIIKTNVNRS